MRCEQCFNRGDLGCNGACETSEVSESASTPCSTLNEFELMNKLATMVGVAAPEGEEIRNASVLYKRRVLRAAIAALESAWQSKA